MRLTFKYRLKPTKPQVAFLTGQLLEACSLYNAAMEERIGAWKVQRKSIQYVDQQRQLPAMRKDGCLTLVNAQCAQDVIRRLDIRFKAFYRRCKTGKRRGFPRFRSARRYDSLTFPTYGNGCCLLPNGKLHVQGAGHIKIVLHRPLEGKRKAVTIKREAGRWYVHFSVEQDARPLPATEKATGIDLGLNSFAVLSDGTTVNNPRYYQKAQAKLRRAQRKLRRRKEGSRRRGKAIQLLRRAHIRVRDQRSDFHHKLSRGLVNEYGLIAVENLNMAGLVRGMMAKSVQDAGWSTFIRKLSYKAESAGRAVVKVDQRGTSQTCICGAAVPKTLADRWHYCPACGLSAGRDHVSAQIILSRAGNLPSGANVEDVVSCVA